MKFINKKFILFIVLLIAFVNSQLFEFMQKKEKKAKSESGNSLFGSARFKNDERGQFQINKSLFNTIKEQNNEPKSSTSKPSTNMNSLFNHDIVKSGIDKKEEIITPPIIKKDSEVEKLDKVIENNKMQLTELEKKSNESTEIQQKELQDMEDKFKEITNKTKKIEKLLNQNKTLKELKDTLNSLKKDEITWDSYINKLKQINHEILELTSDIEKLEHDLKVRSNSKMIEKFFTRKPIENAEVNNLVNWDFNVENFITNELKIGNSLKINDNLIQLPSNYQMNYKGKQYKLSDLIYYNKLANKLRTVCSDNLNCFITLQEEKERNEKDDIIQKTISTIKSHLENIKN
jgi:hypothetical protein